MDIQADIEWIQRELNASKDPDFILRIKELIKNRKQGRPHRISVDQYNIELDQSIQEAQLGRTYSTAEMKQRIKKWCEK